MKSDDSKKDDAKGDEAKRQHDADQLMLALYMGIGITILILVIGAIVECIRIRYSDTEQESKDRYCAGCFNGCCDTCLTRQKSEIEQAEAAANRQKSNPFGLNLNNKNNNDSRNLSSKEERKRFEDSKKTLYQKNRQGQEFLAVNPADLNDSGRISGRMNERDYYYSAPDDVPQLP